jgi:hypothetical protein
MGDGIPPAKDDDVSMEKTRVTQIPVGSVIDFDAHTGCTVFYADSLTKPYGEWERVTGTHVVADRQDATARAHSGQLTSRNREVTITLDNGRTISLTGQSKLPIKEAS